MKQHAFMVYLIFISMTLLAQQPVTLENKSVQLQWESRKGEYHLTAVNAMQNGKTVSLPLPSGEYTLLYSATKPDSIPLTETLKEGEKAFPGASYKFIVNSWNNNLKPVPMNTAGQAIHFFPSQAVKKTEQVDFSHQLPMAKIVSSWQLDKTYAGDILVTIDLTATRAGYYSIATPDLATITENQLSWGILPGFFQGAALQHNLELSYAYGQGIPDRPIITRERTTSTLAPLLSLKNGLTWAVIPQPGTGRNPWTSTRNSHNDWNLGLSLMDRKGKLTPTAYHPVLGEKGSYLKAGEHVSFSFRYTIKQSDWFTVYKHAIYDVYRFKDFLSVKKTSQSLTDRILSMHRYLITDSTSLWRTEDYLGMKIGAQAYLGTVVGADRDAMKNSDYGAMWMLATVMNDPVLKETRLPYARNFKLAQQENEPGFFQGAAIGQYYLSKSKKFVEEWGPYVEPIGLTYYTMLDIGNILLFTPKDNVLKERLRLGAEKLLKWQHADGSWEVGYDRATTKEAFKDLRDYRPTFYGLIVAYRVLGDRKYLDAAIKGADWFIHEAAQKGFFLGVCGDIRFAPDFATGQSAQALLDLYELTHTELYRTTAIDIARLYTSSVYTHPIPDHEKKVVKGIEREDWEISQVGLSFEHGGSIGSANGAGPILLASHAGLFVRMFALSKDSIFIDMARAAAFGRDAFVDSTTSVASYYWHNMNNGAGPFPHHAWWQVGWLTDYLLSEIELRSQGKITFPQGFITPKVGPHKSYGFEPGSVFGSKVQLTLKQDMLSVSDPYVDYFGAVATSANVAFVLLLNNDDEKRTVQVKLAMEKVLPVNSKVRSIVLLNSEGQLEKKYASSSPVSVDMNSYGLAVLKVEYE